MGIPDGGPAFPVVGSEAAMDAEGMSLLDYFAAHAAAGAAAEAFRDSRTEPRDVAKFAYQVAEAMLQRRKAIVG
jgi:hypothetical protein